MFLVQLTVIGGGFCYKLLLLVDVLVRLTVIGECFWYNLLLLVEVESAGDEALDPTSHRLSLSD